MAHSIPGSFSLSATYNIAYDLVTLSQTENTYVFCFCCIILLKISHFDVPAVKEAEHLDWGMRLRIAMGMAYCLEHMHQLNPLIAHNNLTSSSICLTEDYAAKVSEFSFWNDMVVTEIESAGSKNLHTPSADPDSNIYSFGVILFEMVTGKIPYSVENPSFEDWASDYLRGEQPIREMVDPTLTSFQEEQLELIGEVLKSCVHPDPKKRPAMREVCTKLRAITGITPEGAYPRLSPLWWAELEIASADAS